MRRHGPSIHHRSPLYRSLILLALTLVFSGLLVSATPSGAQQTLPWRDKGTPFGVVAALGNRVRGDEMPAAVQMMHEAGVQWQREEIFWHEVQTTPGGPYNWNGDGSGFYDYDRSIGLQVGAGIHVLGLLDYNPAWFKGKNPHPDEWIKDWGDFVYNAVAHYGREKGWVKHWELWNEPNLTRSGYESGLYNIGDFARIMAVGRAAAKAADPDAVIVLGGLASMWGAAPSSHNYDYLDYLQHLADAGAWDSFDVIAIHPYRPDAPEGAPWRNGQNADMRDEFKLLDALLLKYGPKPVWLTELGWTSSTGVEGVDQDTQAFFMVRSYIISIAYPSVEKVFWYDLRDDASPGAGYDQPNYDPHDPEFHYGLMRRAYPLDPNRGDLRKPAFLAYRTLTGMLGGLSLSGVAEDGNDPNHLGVFWYRFAGSGRRVDVLWRTGGSSPTMDVQCGCHEALVRGWNGQTIALLYTGDGNLSLRLESTGAPMYVEYDPPVRDGGTHFAATGHTLNGAFKRYWEANGGLARFGYPLTEELIEPEAGSGRPRVVQYFERNRFEHFPEYSGTPFEVQLGRLGDVMLQRQGVDWQTLGKVDSAPPECVFFAETGHSICPPFRAAWERDGGLAIIGLPLSEPFVTNRADGKQYTVQYFERARMELFPEFAGTPNEVQLGLLGRELIVSEGAMP